MYASECMNKHDLTDRELEVMKLGAEGKSATEIGVALHITTSTAKLHLSRGYHKMGIGGPRAAWVLVARSRELLGK